jgi:hypothetical protein
MTKKSQGRVMRDTVKKEFGQELVTNNNWGQLQSRYDECRNLMLMHLGIGNILENPDIRAAITPEQDKLLSNNIRILTRDLQERAEELKRIYAIHSDKNGNADENDIMLSFEVMEKYTQWLALIETVVQPTVAHILEITSEIEKAVAQQQALTAAQDPADTGPIDVEYTDTPSTQQAARLEEGLAKADHTQPQPE